MIREIESLYLYAKGFEKEFEDYAQEIIAEKGVKTEDGYTCYVDENIKIARLIPKDKMVVDVGCSFGLQHILYQDHKGYIGIQKFKDGINADHWYRPKFKVFTKNAQIIEGMLKDVYGKLGITEENQDEFYGLANHSLWHDLSDNKEDIEIFQRLFPNNYYATDETGVVIRYEIMARPKGVKNKPKENTSKPADVEIEIKTDCNHVWSSNMGGSKRYVCPGCGRQSD